MLKVKTVGQVKRKRKKTGCVETSLPVVPNQHYTTLAQSFSFTHHWHKIAVSARSQIVHLRFSVRGYRKSFQKPSETNIFFGGGGGWGWGGGRKNHTSSFKWAFVHTLVCALKPDVRTFFFFWGGGESTETNFVHFVGLLWTYVMAPDCSNFNLGTSLLDSWNKIFTYQSLICKCWYPWPVRCQIPVFTLESQCVAWTG